MFFTKKPDALYAITAGWPGRQLVLHGVKVPTGAAATMLGVPGALKTMVTGDTLTIVTPQTGPEEAPCRPAFVFRIQGATIVP